MKPIKATPRQAQVLDLLCELGETRLVAYRLKIKPRTVEVYINRVMEENGHPNRLTLALLWDRYRRTKNADSTNLS